MSKGFFSSLSNLVSDSVYVVARAGVAVVSCGLSEIYLQESGHESPMERRERKEENIPCEFVITDSLTITYDGDISMDYITERGNEVFV